MPSLELKKQLSIFVPLADWKALQLEAARRRVPMTHLCRGWLGPHIARLRQVHAAAPRETAEGAFDAR